MTLLNTIDYRPSIPDISQHKIGIIGVGNIVRTQHLNAYQKYNIPVGGVFDIDPQAIQLATADYDVGKVYDSVDALLSDPAITVVDIATHPKQRVELILKALAAGKHVLAQKPLALDAQSAQEVITAAKEANRQLAVNQNGRWTPPWRIATQLIERGVIGDVISVTHMFDTDFSWLVGMVFDDVKHWLWYDYAIHWFDITRCWMSGKDIDVVRAREYRVPNQHPDGKATWGGWAEMTYSDGSNAMIRSIGGSQSVQSGHPFWIHGTQGTIHGSVLMNEYVTLETADTIINYKPEGSWFPDGFAGTAGELLTAIAEDREPFNSAAHNLLTLQMTLAACRSAELDGEPVNPLTLDYRF